MSDPHANAPDSGRRDGQDDGRVVPLRRRRPACPTCGKPAAERFRPFCSKRCADVDLNRWLTGRYAVPSDEPADPGANPDSEPDADPSGGRDDPA